MPTWPDLLTETYGVLRTPLTHLDDSLLDRPTPCAEWSLRDLVRHAIGAIDMFASGAGAEGLEAGGIPADPVEHFDAAVARNIDAWRTLPDPDAILALPMGEIPADLAAGMNQLDSLIHAWDVGAALGLEVSLPSALCEAAMQTARIRVPPGRGRVWGAEVTTSSTSPGDRLLAFSGRDPAKWPGAIWVAGSLVTVKPTVAGSEAASAVEIWEHEGSGPPRHVHAEQDEIWYVLEGQFTFLVGDRQFQAGPGSLVVGQHGVPHTFRADTARSRLLDIHTPGGFERFFVHAGTPATALVPPEPCAAGDQAQLRAAIEAFGATVVGPPLGARPASAVADGTPTRQEREPS